MVVRKRLTKVQDEAHAAVAAAFGGGSNKALAELHTGSGKTRLASRVIDSHLPPGKTALWLTHKHDLKDQAAGEVADHVWVAMVQTLHRRKDVDLSNVGLVVVDEAHHAPAATYRKILDRLPADALRFGITATWQRPDGKLLATIFGEPVFRYTVKQGIENRTYPSVDDSWMILTKSVIEGVTTAKGEYKSSELDRLVVSLERNKAIAQGYIKHGRSELRAAGKKPKAICFCINVRHAQMLAETFNAHGISSTYITGKESVKKRKAGLSKFKSTNEIEILCAVDLLNEGTDVPDVNCILRCRPTRSIIIATQQLGRGSRYLDGVKESLIVLDFVDHTKQGYESFTLANVTGVPYKKAQIDTEYVGDMDPVVLEQWVNVLAGLGGGEVEARVPLYENIEEWAKATRRLCEENGIPVTQKNYRALRHLDPRLPSDPDKLYNNSKIWSWVNGTTKDFYLTKEEWAKATRRLCEENGVPTTLRTYHALRHLDPRLPSSPYRLYNTPNIWSWVSGKPLPVTQPYPKIEEWAKATRRLCEENGVPVAQKNYSALRHLDPRLPSRPDNLYNNSKIWSWVAGTAKDFYPTKEEWAKATRRLCDENGVSVTQKNYRVLRHLDPRLPSCPDNLYNTPNIWSEVFGMRK